MITFLVSVVCLVLGYLFYGRFVEKLFGIDASRKTPAAELRDGVDYVELKPWRAFMIQLLNIAGLGPIFGAVLGAAYGPVACLWIVLGCVFMGAAHDFFSGAISMRMKGAGLPDIVGRFLGAGTRNFLVVFSGVMLLAVGIAFVSGPASVLSELAGTLLKNAPEAGTFSAAGIALPAGAGTLSWLKIWIGAIIVYYVCAVILPIDKIIGRIYPLFSVALLFMVFGVGGAMLVKAFAGEITIPELTLDTLRNFHSDPDANPLFPTLFVVISCGAISGFHATQSPMMARCLGNEKYARPIFYGAMIAEGVIALIWAAAASAYCGGADGLNAAFVAGKEASVIVNEICSSWLGAAGAVAAILGVVVCPITSGDTALRSVRLIVADAFSIPQKSLLNRILVSVPIFAAAFFLSGISFAVIWRYVGLANQVLAAFTLWACAVWLAREGKPHQILSVPAAFLSAVCATYFLCAEHAVGGLALPLAPSCVAGTLVGAALFIFFVLKCARGGNAAGGDGNGATTALRE